jgi:hypothetical protein
MRFEARSASCSAEPEESRVNSSFTAIQRANFSILNAIRDEVRQDAAMACCRFRLHIDLLTAIGELSAEALVSIVETLGNETLFFPRSDIEELLAKPEPLTAILASVRAPASNGATPSD